MDQVPQPETDSLDVDRFFDIALDMLCISSGDGYFKKLNPAFSRVLGWRMDELLNTPYLAFVHPEDIERTAKEVEKQMADGQIVFHFENRYRHKDGGYRILAWKSVPQPNGLMYAVARDVTDLREQQEDLKGKYADLELFTRAVAHDLRAPIRAIGSYAKLIEENSEDQLPEQARSDLSRIRQNVVNMDKMTESLLRFARAGVQELDMTEVDLKELAHRVAQEVSEAHPERPVEFRISELPVRRCDPEMIKIVFTNLIANAVKYTKQTPQPVVEIGCETQNGRTEFHVRDNGAGFDMKDVHKLFDLFKRIHPVSAYDGHGIGLATVHRILQRHGGSVRAYGEPEKGATLYFTIG